MLNLRVEMASPEECLRRDGVPLFPNARALEGRDRWSHWTIRDRWHDACETAASTTSARTT